MGYGSVAVSDSSLLAASFAPGLGSGGGKEKSLEVLRSLAVGDNVLEVMVDRKQNLLPSGDMEYGIWNM